MKVLHFEKNYEYTDRDLIILSKKIGKLATYCKRLKDASSSIRVDTEMRKTQKSRDAIKLSITVDLPDKTLRAESRKPTVLEAIDRCTSKLETQVKKYKEMHDRKRGMRRK